MQPLELLSSLQRHAVQRPDAPAYRSDGATLTWSQLHHAVLHVTAMFAAKMPAGTTLLVCSPNRPEVAIAVLAGLAAGLRTFPVSPEASTEELKRLTSQSSSIAIAGAPSAIAAVGGSVTHSWPIDSLAPSSLTPSAHTASTHRSSGELLLQSSGTTGFPRIVCRKAPALDAVASAIVNSVGFQPVDHVLAMLPLSHSYGIEHGLLAPICAGSTVLLGQGLDINRITRELASSATLFPTVPSVIECLADLPAPAGAAPSICRIYSAGSPLPLTVFNRFQSRYGLRASQLYGATEVGSVTFNPPDTPDFDPGSVGLPMSGVSIRILEFSDPTQILPAGREGQIAIRTTSMLSSYLDGEPILADGHFLTGDLGLLDETGRLTITGRLKLLIDVGGIKVNPMEIESVLREHPAVGACVVVPIQQSETVFRIKAVVTPRDPDHPPSIDELRALAREQLSSYKVPRVFEMRDSLPVTSTGKVMRHRVELP